MAASPPCSLFSSKGRREMPDDTIYIDGGLEQLSRGGSFLGQHVATSLQGVAVHINAFNFPVWGMLEKLAPTAAGRRPGDRQAGLLDGVAGEAAFRMIVESNILPEGAVQFVAGSTGDLLDRLGITGRRVLHRLGRDGADAALQSEPAQELDTLHCRAGFAQRLDPRARRGTRHAGIRCLHQGSPSRRDDGQGRAEMHPLSAASIVPEGHRDARYRRSVRQPRQDGCRQSARRGDTHWGALARPRPSATNPPCGQRRGSLASEARLVFGDMDKVGVDGLDAEKKKKKKKKGRLPLAPASFFSCDDPPDHASRVHEVEAFGPVSTVMGYRDVAHAAALANRGGGLAGRLDLHA